MPKHIFIFDLIGTDEAAHILGITKATLTRWVQADHVTAAQTPRQKRRLPVPPRRHRNPRQRKGRLMTDTPSIPDPSLEALQALAELPFIALAALPPDEAIPALKAMIEDRR